MTQPVMLMTREEARAHVIARNAERGVVEVSVRLSARRLVAGGLVTAAAQSNAADDLLVSLAASFTPEGCEVEFLSEDMGGHVVSGRNERCRAAAKEALARIGI
jgi:hypothetical protein